MRSPRGALDAVCRNLVTTTTTLAVRVRDGARRALPRDSVEVVLEGQIVSVKRVFLDGDVTTLQPEFDDARAAAGALRVPVEEIMRRVRLGLPDDDVLDGTRHHLTRPD